MAEKIKGNNMEEIWKPVVGYEGIYEVSNLGNLRSLDRYVTQINRWGVPMRRFFKGRRLMDTAGIKKLRYINTTLKDANRKGKLALLHRLVAEAFIENPKGYPYVNHLNGDKHDNRACNLEWCTPRMNAEHASKTGLLLTGARNPISKAVVDLQTGIFYDSCKEAAKAYGIKYTTLAGRLNGNDPNHTSLRYA